MDGSPCSLLLFAAAALAIFLAARALTGRARKAGMSALYDAAKEMSLQVIDDSSSVGVDVPRIGGMIIDRPVEISGFRKAPAAGEGPLFVRISIPHQAYVLKPIVLEYNFLKKPPLQCITIDGREHPRGSLLKIKAFNEELLRVIEEYLHHYTVGPVAENSILEFITGEARFDREISLTGDSAHFADSVLDLQQIVKSMDMASQENVPGKPY
jgi:hypothetical protein